MGIHVFKPNAASGKGLAGVTVLNHRVAPGMPRVKPIVQRKNLWGSSKNLHDNQWALVDRALERLKSEPIKFLVVSGVASSRLYTTYASILARLQADGGLLCLSEGYGEYEFLESWSSVTHKKADTAYDWLKTLKEENYAYYTCTFNPMIVTSRWLEYGLTQLGDKVGVIFLPTQYEVSPNHAVWPYLRTLRTMLLGEPYEHFNFACLTVRATGGVSLSHM